MTPFWRWLATLGLACSTAHAVECKVLFEQEGAPDLYYALVFVDAADEEKRDHLMSQVTPLLNDIARKHGADSKRRLRLELLVCEHRIGSRDFNIDEMREYLRAKVIAVFWKVQEGDKPGLVQLAVPVYIRNDGTARRDVEVVTVYTGRSENPVESWIEVLGQDSSMYKPFISMGLATVYQRDSDYLPAWKALCESRAGLSSLAPSLLRPERKRLDDEIAGPLVQLMNDLEQAARRAGIPALPRCQILPP